MNVLVIFSGDLWAGAEVMIFNLLAQLHNSGRVHILALSLNEGILTERLRAVPIETHVLPENRYSFLEITRRALRLLRGHEFRVIHSHRYKENLLAVLLSLRLRPRLLVTTVHGLPEPTDGRRPRLDPLVRLNYAVLRRRFSRIVAVSHDIKRRLIQELDFKPASVAVIHNGLRLPDVPGSPPAERAQPVGEPHIGTVGRLAPVKDFNLFLAIASQLVTTVGKIRFSILGDGPLRDGLARHIIELGIRNCCQILPPVTDPMPYYRSLDIYLNTSRHEGIPMSILEAMACGVPIVAPSVGGIPEVVSHGVEGLLVGSRTPGEFTQACRMLLADHTLRGSLGQNARRTLEDRFSATAMASRYFELYGSAS